MRTNERRVWEGVMPWRPALGFFRPPSRSLRTSSITAACSSKKSATRCKVGSRWTPWLCNWRSAKLSCGSRVRLISGSGLAVTLWPEQFVVEFTHALQGGLELAVVAQALLDQGFLLR